MIITTDMHYAIVRAVLAFDRVSVVVVRKLPVPLSPPCAPADVKIKQSVPKPTKQPIPKYATQRVFCSLPLPDT